MNTGKLICSKNNIILKRFINNINNNINNINNTNYFTIELQIMNKLNIDMKNIINYKLFNFIGLVNTDTIEKSEIVDMISDVEVNVLYIFKRFGSDLGISKKYCFLNTIIEYTSENQILIRSKSIPYEKIIEAEPIICNDAKLYATNLNKPSVDIHYTFNLNIEEELPIYMQNILGLLMKKILNNFKVFIENINNSSLENI